MPELHEFHRSSKVEDRWAPVLDAWLGEHYSFRPATMAEQWRGIDRVAVDDSGREAGIDYKCDTQAGRTNNVFIETVSNDQSGRPGWAETSEAEWIFYFVTPGLVLAFRTVRLREALRSWQRRYPTRGARNGRYTTMGVCVPIQVAKTVAEYTARLDEGDGPVLAEFDQRQRASR